MKEEIRRTYAITIEELIKRFNIRGNFEDIEWDDEAKSVFVTTSEEAPDTNVVKTTKERSENVVVNTTSNKHAYGAAKLTEENIIGVLKSTPMLTSHEIVLNLYPNLRGAGGFATRLKPLLTKTRGEVLHTRK
jgi:hypothetical protein